MSKIVTTLTAPGERAVKVDGQYAGLITREAEGWKWAGGPRAFRTFTEAAQYTARRWARRQEELAALEHAKNHPVDPAERAKLRQLLSVI